MSEVKNKDIANCTEDELSRFDLIMKPIMKLVDKYWDASAEPKGYKEFVENYEDYEGIGEPEYKLEWDGFDSSTATNSSFEDRMSLPSIAYDDKGQGRKPLEMLIGNVLGYGMLIGSQREKAKGKTKKDLGRVQRYLNYATKHLNEKVKSGEPITAEDLNFLDDAKWECDHMMEFL